MGCKHTHTHAHAHPLQVSTHDHVDADSGLFFFIILQLPSCLVSLRGKKERMKTSTNHQLKKKSTHSHTRAWACRTCSTGGVRARTHTRTHTHTLSHTHTHSDRTWWRCSVCMVRLYMLPTVYWPNYKCTMWHKKQTCTYSLSVELEVKKATQVDLQLLKCISFQAFLHHTWLFIRVSCSIFISPSRSVHYELSVLVNMSLSFFHPHSLRAVNSHGQWAIADHVWEW